MLDHIDRALVQALQINGRASYTLIGAALGVSTQTVARRYRQLRATAGLRVVGLVDIHHDNTQRWIVRITAGPHTAPDVAMALARRSDAAWVKLTSGGTEIFSVIQVPIGDDHSLLLRDIPRTAGVTAVSAHLMLHTYIGGPTSWRGHTDVLDERQRTLLAPPSPAPGSGRDPVEADRPLLAALQRDGRASLAALAAITGWTPATVARRLTDLQASGALFFDVDVDATHLGASTVALLWMSVAPAQVDAVGTALARHHELAVVAATTGPTNLLAQVMCTGPAELHRYLTRELGALAAIRTIETAPVLRTLKATSPITPPDRRSTRPRIDLHHRA